MRGRRGREMTDVLTMLRKHEAKAGAFLGSGIGIVFVVLGRRILDGTPGVFPARREPCSQSPCARKE